MSVVTIYCDGSAIGNPGPGGWGAVILYEDTKENKIKVKSYIRYTKIATLDIGMSLGRTGTLEAKTYQKLIQEVKRFIS